MTRTTMLIYNPNLFNIYRGKFADDGSEGVGGGGGGGGGCGGCCSGGGGGCCCGGGGGG